ncbi:phage minor capsid protein [Spongiactinospora sp. TRM90649]|uniref:phage minor capsid protein n=1 Tax=Spongiactinospora sp. TRM90649 TaxID=3031114 RepID=UPI0023F6497F|nr:phage minor capsid protein [Spongiactinospora sp. TRM90649]MDF5756649.1 hypothetical protein [Spongiactinospora sp. TRM90649]
MAESASQAIETAIDQAKRIAEMYEQAELDLLEAIARQARRGIDVENTETWATRRLGEVQQLRTEAAKIIRRLNDAKRAAAKAVRDAYADGANTAQAEVAAQLADAKARNRIAKVLTDARKLGASELVNPGAGVNELARQLDQVLSEVQTGALRGVDDIYRQVVGFVAGSELTGALTFRQVVGRALQRFAGQGVKSFTDRAGRTWGLREYAEMATRTATARAARDGHLATLRDAGLDLVLVSTSVYPCTVCRPWEGEVLAQRGEAGMVELEHAVNDGEVVRVDVRATVAEARARGLGHPGCTHGFGAYLPGVSKPAPRPPTTATYGDVQKQRRLEREVRAWKRKQIVATDARSRRYARQKATEAQERLQRHLAETGLRRKRDREQVRRDEPPLDQPFTAPEPQRPSDPAPAVPTRDSGRGPGTAEDAGRQPAPGASRPQVRAGGPVSQETADRINAARRALPVDREQWLDARSSFLPDERVVDRLIRKAQKTLTDLEAKRKTARVRDDIERVRRELGRYHDITTKRREDLIDYERRLLDTAAPEREYRYRTDRSGALLPPETYEAHLDQVLEAGEALREDLMRLLRGDARRSELERERIAAQRRHRDLDDQVKSTQTEIEKTSRQSGAGRDKRLAELYDRHRLLVADRDQAALTHGGLRRDLRRREADLVRDLLGRVRGMGGRMEAEAVSGDRLRRLRVKKARDDWADLLEEILPSLPSDWIRRTAGNRLHVATSADGRAFHSERNDLIALDEGGGGSGNGAFSSSSAEVFLHEMGHRMEAYVPGLRDLEFTMVRRRATKDGTLEKPVQMRTADPYSGYGSHEMTYRDDWPEPYIGKTYESPNDQDPARQSWEIFQMGLQDLFGRGDRKFGDLDLERFMLGVLGVL